jgi:monoamine oxidase
MPRLSRRSFLAASAFLAASPAFADKPSGEDVDVIVIGAGAAGIAAARKLKAERLRVLVLEARERIGGRCVTDTTTFGIPFDRGAHWIHNPGSNPVVTAANAKVDPASRWQVVHIGSRPARDAEMEVFLAGQVRAQRALREPAKNKTDVPATRALPDNLGAWRTEIEFLLGPYTLGKELSDVSAAELVSAAERANDAFAADGYGTLLARAATGLPIRTSKWVKQIRWEKGVMLETEDAIWFPRAVILTCSTDALIAPDIKFVPPLPKRVNDAASSLALGSLDHIALDIPGNPFGLQKDDVVIEQANSPRTAALLANVSGTSLHVVTVGGNFGRELSAKGEPAMIDFAIDWLGSLFGRDVKRLVKNSAATRWNAERYIYGSMSAAGPGHGDARRVLHEPLNNKVWLAGEALHETKWGTVEGAWESGERAADSVAKYLHRQDAREARPARKRKR